MQQSSSSSQRPSIPLGLSRYGSAPGSFLSNLVDSVVGGSTSNHGAEYSGGVGGTDGNGLMPGRSRFFTTTTTAGDSPCITSESSCKAAENKGGGGGSGLDIGLNQPFGGGLNSFSMADLAMNSSSSTYKGGGGGGGGGSGSSPLFRHSSSPAGFLSHLMDDNGFSVTRGGGGYCHSGTEGINVMANRRLKSQLSFSSRPDFLSHISEISIPEESGGGGHGSDEAAGNMGQSYIASNFHISPWEESNSIVFSAPPSKHRKDNNGDIVAALSNIDPQYGLPRTALEMANVENLFQFQQDSVPCKIRAKRGCATHPRSIAERERRTRISEKLRKLQDLVPNMDKQTSTADMLDLAVQHIKGLQSHVQKLNQECKNCTCGSRHDVS